MSARKRPVRSARNAGSPPRTRRASAPNPRTRLIVTIAGLAVAAFGIWAVGRDDGRHRTLGARESLSRAALDDSVRAGIARREWTRTLHFAERLAAADPLNSNAIRNLAVMIHNQATASVQGPEGPRPALRTSLERIESEIRVHALLDSASRLAANDTEWARAQLWYGMSLERLGVPIHALGVFTTIGARVPAFTEVNGHIGRLAQLLVNPVAPLRMTNPEPGAPPK